MNIIHDFDLVKQFLSLIAKIAGIRKLSKKAQEKLLYMFAKAGIRFATAILTVYIVQIWVDIILKVIEVVKRLG